MTLRGLDTYFEVLHVEWRNLTLHMSNCLREKNGTEKIHVFRVGIELTSDHDAKTTLFEMFILNIS